MKLIEPGTPTRNPSRSWAKGSFTIFANDVECFSWAGTKQDAINIQKRLLETVGTLGIRGIPPDVYAVQAASYLIAYGVPAAGDIDRRPSGLSDQRWSADEALGFRYAILRAALREHVSDTPDAGDPQIRRVEDIFVGRRFEIRFKGSQEANRASMARAQQQQGEPSGNDDEDNSVRMRTTELDELYLLDPQDAVCIPYRDLLALAGRRIEQIDPAVSPTRDLSISETTIPETAIPETVYVPRIPIDAAEADAMLRMTTLVADATDPAMPPRTYAGYTREELSGGESGVLQAQEALDRAATRIQ
jgi:hypothetical protein